jgi:hypothetical protein
MVKYRLYLGENFVNYLSQAAIFRSEFLHFNRMGFV